MARVSFQNVDEYIAAFPVETQRMLGLLRRTIIDAAPGADEKISYDMPSYTLNGSLVYFAGYKKHIGLYGAGPAVDVFPSELAPYITGKGTLRFELNDPLPVKLISSAVKYRVQQNLAKADEKSAKAKAGHTWPAKRGIDARLP